MTFTDEHRLLHDYAERLLREQGPVSHLRALRDNDDELGYDAPLWQAMIDAGWTGLLVPERFGGLDFGYRGAGLIAEQIGRNLSLTPFLPTVVGAAVALSHGGTSAQQEWWLPRLAAGELLCALAIDEGAKHHQGPYRTLAQQDSQGWRLNGSKTLVLDGHIADLLLVAAQTEHGAALFLVDPCAGGVTLERTRMVDSRNAALLTLDNAPAEPLADGAGALQAALTGCRAVLAAELAGIALGSFEITLAYLKERRQFERHIGSFQALQHRAAQWYADAHMSAALAQAALAALDAGDADAQALSCAAKAKANQVARLAAAEAVQMHGGIGMTDEFDIGFYMKRARAAEESFGDTAFCLDRFAQLKQY
ncbi:acyl-CoA dehydrogenase family protein [Isoalcanivorax beigongshangi]|uniref:Acyl-CoA dehydrogenase family protein n=1 Tax=Isoalcanivorax beigongshangi TaxID=3238810 RepID=A0ABV4AI03_9GAMM